MGTERLRGALRTTSVVLRCVVFFNVVNTVIDMSRFGPAFSHWLRAAHLFDASYYWLVYSLWALPAVVLVELLITLYIRFKDGAVTGSKGGFRGVGVDAALVGAWIVTFFFVAFRSAGFL